MYEGKIFQALQFASQRHAQQKRKCFDYPYITHPIMVFHMVSQFSADEDTLIAALLHDTVEDTDTSLQEVEQLFGRTVAEYVDWLSEDKAMPYHERKKTYAERFKDAPKEVLLIKGADIFYNLADSVLTLGECPKQKFAESIRTEGWIDINYHLISLVSAAWPENPFIPYMEKKYRELSAVVHTGSR